MLPASVVEVSVWLCCINIYIKTQLEGKTKFYACGSFPNGLLQIVIFSPVSPVFTALVKSQILYTVKDRV